MQQLWLVTVPNKGESSDTTHQVLTLNVQNCKLYPFEMPGLLVGTLDSLMALSDDLAKINSQVENVVRKVERQYLEVSGPQDDFLRVGSKSVETYLTHWSWDFTKYQPGGRQLSELVSQVQSMTATVDEELKKISASHNEKNLALSTLERKKTINPTTSDFEDFLSAETVSKLVFSKADKEKDELLETVMVVVPLQLEGEFLRTYSDIGSTIVEYPSEGSAGAVVHGSPVCPTSACRIAEVGDSVLYSILIIKFKYVPGKFEGETWIPGSFETFLEPLRQAFREKRFVLREWSYDGNRPGGIDGQISAARVQVEASLSNIRKWCQAHFGEVYSGWMHLKVIRGFVESVLRYGLPVNFYSCFLEPAVGKDKLVKDLLSNTIGQFRPELTVKKLEGEEEEDEETDNLPYVCQRFGVIGAGGGR